MHGILDTIDLETARILKHMSMEEVATQIGVHAQTYSKIEKNPDKASIEVAKKLSNLYGFSVDTLFLNDNSKKLRE